MGENLTHVDRTLVGVKSEFWGSDCPRHKALQLQDFRAVIIPGRIFFFNAISIDQSHVHVGSRCRERASQPLLSFSTIYLYVTCQTFHA